MWTIRHFKSCIQYIPVNCNALWENICCYCNFSVLNKMTVHYRSIITGKEMTNDKISFSAGGGGKEKKNKECLRQKP